MTLANLFYIGVKNINILFLSLLDFDSLKEKNIYTDLLRTFRDKGHNLYIVSPMEKRKKQPTRLIYEDEVSILKLRIGNIQKTNNMFEKGLSILTVEQLAISGIKKYFSNVKFDLVLYSTPPITFAKVIDFVKKRDNAKSYLLLKDIFPQNAIDIGIINKKGVTAFIYKFFRKKEKRLYQISDYIGCMSKANVDYLLNHNPELPASKVHINPNSFEVEAIDTDANFKNEIYEKYNIPKNATTFIYGGNLGKPQCISFVIDCLKANVFKDDRYFVICGSGTEYDKLYSFIESDKPSNVLLLDELSSKEYKNFVKAFDVGLIFLDHRFTIPNFPSRILSYMEAKLPVLACTDKNTDIGNTIKNGNFGWWCESNNVADFTQKIELAINSDLELLGENAYSYLLNNFTVDSSYKIIIDNISDN